MQDRYGIRVQLQGPAVSHSSGSSQSSHLVIGTKTLALDQLEDYRFRGSGLRKLCLYDYKCMMERKSKAVVLRPVDEMIVPCFVGMPLCIDDPDQKQREHATAIFLGLFILWEEIDACMEGVDSPFIELWDFFEPGLSARLRFIAGNFNLLRKSQEECDIDREQLAALNDEAWAEDAAGGGGGGDPDEPYIEESSGRQLDTTQWSTVHQSPAQVRAHLTNAISSIALSTGNFDFQWKHTDDALRSLNDFKPVNTDIKFGQDIPEDLQT
ncbi:hypothetical protein Dda_7030 [Drechslerella dactyloides]|uniref:Uncharacterized protein n=1 Tax=Drechslerella dactyloides TaxID=74499 RepID=A0AAD6NH37_DREDA|nr:hypothetical protein Dda_7030 [Drechslerella dactyloides]